MPKSVNEKIADVHDRNAAMIERRAAKLRAKADALDAEAAKSRQLARLTRGADAEVKP